MATTQELVERVTPEDVTYPMDERFGRNWEYATLYSFAGYFTTTGSIRAKDASGAEVKVEQAFAVGGFLKDYKEKGKLVGTATDMWGQSLIHGSFYAGRIIFAQKVYTASLLPMASFERIKWILGKNEGNCWTGGWHLENDPNSHGQLVLYLNEVLQNADGLVMEGFNPDHRDWSFGKRPFPELMPE